MKILFIAPLPPPTNGQSFASETLFNFLKNDHEILLVNMAKPNRVTNFYIWILRFFSVISFFFKVYFYKSKCDIIYFTISESRFGNIKDLIIYMLCYSKLRNTTIHLLGGAGMKEILGKKGIWFYSNKFFLKKLNAVIVEGNIQASTFKNIVSDEKIKIVTNFSADYLFSNNSEIQKKFHEISPINVLYLSNLIFGKGYLELANAYNNLPNYLKNKINLSFVGGFHSEKNKNDFMKLINNESGIKYLGKFINGLEKKELYMKSHVFALPTYYPFEGQPISILEAYSTGCVVLTTNHSGIPQVFKDKINGYEVEKKSIKSITEALKLIIEQKEKLIEIGLLNYNTANLLYRSESYINNIIKILKLK